MHSMPQSEENCSKDKEAEKAVSSFELEVLVWSNGSTWSKEGRFSLMIGANTTDEQRK